MKRTVAFRLAVGCVLAVATAVVSGQSQDAASQLSQDEGLRLVRTINTAQAESFIKTKMYVSLDKLLQHRFFQQRPAGIVLADETSGAVKNYKLSVIASADGKHYAITLAPSEPSTCAPALFSNEVAVIYPSKALGCKP